MFPLYKRLFVVKVIISYHIVLQLRRKKGYFEKCPLKDVESKTVLLWDF